jgi:hypothetical protein
MFKRTMAVAFAIALAMSAGSVAAQTPCTVGVYANEGASSSVVAPAANSNFDVYVVLFAESLADAVSYRLVAEGLGTDYVQVAAAYGPDGEGFNIPFNGENVGLGVCAVGYNGFPLVVTKYTFFQINPAAPSTSISVAGGNENPDFPVFSNCQGLLSPCVIGSSLTVDNVVSSDAESFGAVKSLFRN